MDNAEKVAQLYEDAEKQAAEAAERYVGSGGFASLLGMLALARTVGPGPRAEQAVAAKAQAQFICAVRCRRGRVVEHFAVESNCGPGFHVPARRFHASAGGSLRSTPGAFSKRK